MSAAAGKGLLITGGSGRLGRALRGLFPEAQLPDRSALELTDPGSIRSCIARLRPARVLHAAAVADVRTAENDRALAHAVNVQGTRELLAASRALGVEHFVYVSTACVFSGVDERMPDEDTLPQPKHYYGLTKYVAEELCHRERQEGLSVTITRTNFSSMPWPYPQAFTDRFGTYLFAEDVASALRDVLAAPPAQAIVHLCGKRRLSMYEYARLGGSDVAPMSLADYDGPPLTVDMSITSKYWPLYAIGHARGSDG